MLSTDAWSPHVKNKMTFEHFRKNLISHPNTTAFEEVVRQIWEEVHQAPVIFDSGPCSLNSHYEKWTFMITKVLLSESVTKVKCIVTATNLEVYSIEVKKALSFSVLVFERILF